MRWLSMSATRRWIPSCKHSPQADLALRQTRRALTQVYTNLGVLTTDPEVINHQTWGRLQNSVEIANVQEWRDQNRVPGTVQAGQSLSDLHPGELQNLAVWRSQRADVRMWVERLKNFYSTLPKGDQASRASLEGVLLRVEQFAEGQMAAQLGDQRGEIDARLK
jgi:hypothetical protein